MTTRPAPPTAPRPRSCARALAPPLALDPTTGRLPLAALAGPCVAYGVDLGPGDRRRRLGATAGGDRILPAGLLLWRPHPLPAGARATARFALADGLRVSAPWPRRPDRPDTYDLDDTAFRWLSHLALGAFTPLHLDLAGAPVEVVVLAGDRRLSDEGLRRWLEAALGAVAGLYGAPPAPALQVLVVPVPGDDEPVYFGLVGRGGGASVLLYIAADADDDAFPGEWVAIHELLHLGMPYLDRADAWLAEGFVTYFTEVARARAGLRPPDRAWRALADGYLRGAAAARPGLDLAAASRTMEATRRYTWVYWGGAAIALLADLALRQATDGERGLDAAMAHLHRCCARSPRAWSAAEVLAELDRWAARPWLVPLAERALAGTGFAELPASLADLGVTDRDRALADDAPLAALRRAITAPRAPAPTH